MKPSTRQRGLLLLPVAIALAIMGALAYSMARAGAYDVAAVDAQYRLEAARYLAEGGLRLAKWQNEMIAGCHTRRFSRVRLPGVAGEMSVESLTVRKNEYTAIVTATADGAVSRQTRNKMAFYDRTRLYSMTLPDSEFKDTYISSMEPGKSNGNSSTLEATDDKTHILVGVSLSKVPKDAWVTRATFWLYLNGSSSVQTVRQLAAHAVTRPWTDGSATWNSPWNTTPGGSYETRPEAVTALGGNGWYGWEIGALMQRWRSEALANNGMLFKPQGLNKASFNSENAGNNRPRMDVSYQLRCKSDDDDDDDD